MRILLVEDDRSIADGLLAGLGSVGMKVDWVQTGGHALTALRTHAYSVVVLDLGLPDMDGLTVLEQSRSLPRRAPVLILSARNLPAHRVQGLNLGADDYLVKPFDFDELVARLHALHRRSLATPSPECRVGELCLNPITREVRQGARALVLAPKEFDVLHALIEQPGAVRSSAWLEQRLYAWGQEVASNAIQVHIHHLKRKLGEGWIQNIRGVGYKLAPPPATVAHTPAAQAPTTDSASDSADPGAAP